MYEDFVLMHIFRYKKMHFLNQKSIFRKFYGISTHNIIFLVSSTNQLIYQENYTIYDEAPRSL